MFYRLGKKIKKTSDRRGRGRGRWKEYAMQMKYNRANYALLYTLLTMVICPSNLVYE